MKTVRLLLFILSFFFIGVTFVNAESGSGDVTVIVEESPVVDGVWTDWNSCNALCGTGTQTRSCTNPPPSGGGADCSGPTVQTCNTQSCPVDGGWTDWGSCSASCDGGTQTRSCTNPSPSGGGDDCSGNSSQSCNTQYCPENGYWSEWSEQETSCGYSGTQTRYCIGPYYGGANCVGPTTSDYTNPSCLSNITSLSVSPNPVPYGSTTTIFYSCSNGYYSHIFLDWSWAWDDSGYFSSRASTTPVQTVPGSHTVSAFCYNSDWISSDNSWYTVGYTVNPPPSGTLSASNCSISAGNSSCNSSLSWSTSYPLGTSAVTTPTSITVATANSSSTTYSVAYGSRNFYLYNNGSLLDSKTATASCTAGTGWYDGACRTPINGGWTAWSARNESCASYTETRTQTRTCTQPIPQYGGADCVGSTTQTYTIPACLSNITSLYVSPSVIPYGGSANIYYSCTNGYYSHVMLDDSWAWNDSGYYSSRAPTTSSAIYSPGSHYAMAYCYNSDWVPSANSWSRIGTFTVSNAPTPTPDLKVTAWGSTNADGTIETYTGSPYTLSWGAVSSATSCTINGSAVSVSGGTQGGTASLRTQSFTLNCTNATGQSASDSVTITTPPVPTNFTNSCSADSMTSTISWTAPSGYNTFYTRATNPSSTYVLNNDSATGTSNSFSISPNTNYSAWVHTRNASNGAWSDAVYTYINCARTHTLTYTAGSGGTISGSSSQTVNYGTNGTAVTAVQNAGYTFASWSDGVTTATRTDTSVTANKSVTASFTLNSYTVSTSAGTGGSISPTSRTVNYGSTTTFTVTPNSGYSIGTVSGCSGSGSSTYTTGAITGACTVSATFLALSGSLTPASSSCVIALNSSSCNTTLTWSTTNPIGTSAVTASGMTNVNGNSGSQAFSVPYSSRIFYLYNNGLLLASSSATSSCTANTTWNGSICAINTFTISASSGTNGSVTPTGVTTKDYGTNQTYTITPSTNYHIVSVLVDGSSVGAVGSYTFSNITTSHTISASFTIDTYTLTVNKAGTGAGDVTGAGTYNYGQAVTATASPNTGSSFAGWSGDCNGSGQVTITSTKTCTATFTTVTTSITVSPTTYNTIPNTNISFAYTPSTNIGTTECRLLDNASSALTGYQASSPIVHTPPSSAGAYGYYIQCRNTTHTTVTTTSALITVTVVTVSVSAGTPYNVGPNTSVPFTYTATTNSGTTECLLLDNVLAPLTAYQLASPIIYTVPNNIGSYGYYVKCRNRTTTTAMANSNLIIVNTACSYGTPGTSWNGSACVTPSGNITTSNCLVTVGNNSCNSTLVWSTTYPIGTSAVTTPTNITVSATNSGTTTYSIAHGSRNFYLYNNSNLLSQAMATASCTSGTVWNATTGICEPPTGTLSASGCIISAGNSSCDSTLIWTTNNPLIGITSVIKTPTSSGTTVATANSSAGTSYAVPYNSRAFVLVHNGVTLSSATPISACAQKTTWNGSVCELNAPEIDLFTADPATIFEGKASTLTWSADPDLVTYCTGTGFSTGGLTSGSVRVSPIVTTTYSLTCGRTGYPSDAESAIVKVIVLTIKEE
jgi:hypothetical protein